MPNRYDLRAIEQKLAEDDRTHELGIHLRQRGERLFVSGTVGSEESRASVLQIIREAADGHEIVDDLVCSQSELSQVPETSEEIR